MSFYSESLAKVLQEKIAFFKSANLSEEAELLQARLDSLAGKSVENLANTATPAKKNQAENPMVEIARGNLRSKLSTDTRHIPELERQYILENASRAKTLKELETLRIACIERALKISRASRSEKIASVLGNDSELGAGPYNNEKAFNEALRLIYSQDPLWIEDFKELYFSIMPLSSAAATSKSPL
jgi:hypothetical protein